MTSNSEIVDRRGKKFKVTADVSDGLWIFKVWAKGRPDYLVGDANVLELRGVPTLMQIEIRNSVSIPNPRFIGRLFNPRVLVCYRNRGLGNALLEFIVRYATRRDHGQLEVERVHAFANNNVELDGWYASHGFSHGETGMLRRLL